MFWYKEPNAKTEKTDDDGDRYRSHRALLNQLANNTSLLVFSTFTHNACEALSPLTDLVRFGQLLLFAPVSVCCYRTNGLQFKTATAIQLSSVQFSSAVGHKHERSGARWSWLVVVASAFGRHTAIVIPISRWKALMRLQGIEYFGELCVPVSLPPPGPTARDYSVLGGRR